MHTIILRQVGISTPDILFQNLALTIGENDRVGLVAGNGCGKTSLLRCVAERDQPSEGCIARPKGSHIGYVEQNMPLELLDLTLKEAVLEALPHIDQAQNAWRVDMVLDEFEATSNLQTKLVRHLSGGWQRLALIARAWVMAPDALLLDEPTNHLDLEKIFLLESWINDPQRQIPMMIASHDRSFLDACTTHTLFLRPGVSKYYGYSYSRARQLLADDDATESAELDRNIKEAERLRRSAGELKNIGINSRSDALQKKSKQMSQRADDLEQSFIALHKDHSATLRLNSRETHAKVLVDFKDVVVRDPSGLSLFRIDRLKVFQGDRIIIEGKNGVGKSQFIDMIRNAVREPGCVSGLHCYPGIILGYADQQMAQLPDSETPFGHILNLFDLGDQRVRSLLAGAGFPVSQQNRPIGQFSLGQKARLGMLALRLTQPNFYLLDEPTNHVDIAGQEKLEDEIMLQKATCIIVSHDRSFIKAVGTRYLLIEKGRLIEKSNTF